MAIRNGNRRYGKGHGFTLIELTVVLLILVALAGVMVPLLTGYVERSQAAARATTESDLTKQIELYKVKTLKGYPDKWDSLLDSAGSTAWSRLPWDNTAMPILTPTQLDASTLASLKSAGITTLKDSGSIGAGQSATFTVPATEITLAVGSYVAAVTSAMSLTMCVPNADTVNYHYFLFGLGDGCTAVGSVMTTAPIHNDTLDAQQVYQHYGAIFKVPKAGTPNAGAGATLVNVVYPRNNGIHALMCAIKSYNQATSSY